MNFLKNLFKSKTKLEIKRTTQDLLNKAFIASKTNRSLSDTYTFEAGKIEEKIIGNKKSRKNLKK